MRLASVPGHVAVLVAADRQQQGALGQPRQAFLGHAVPALALALAGLDHHQRLRRRQLQAFAGGRQVGGEQSAGGVAEVGDLVQPRAHPQLAGLQAPEGVAEGAGGIVEEVCVGRLQVRLVARVDHHHAAADDMVDPGAVEVRLHHAPAVQEDHQRSVAGDRLLGGEHPVFASAFAEVPLMHAGMAIGRAARPFGRLRRRRGRGRRFGGRRGVAQEQAAQDEVQGTEAHAGPLAESECRASPNHSAVQRG